MKLPSPIQLLEDELFKKHDIAVYIKRDDLIHPQISGNKWRKLKFNIEKFRQGGYDKILTFGGAYSNHIAATAALTKETKVASIGIIRGDELNFSSNETLKRAHENGMELIFTPREEYALRDEKYYHEELRRRHGNVLIIPEGGKNFHGMLGCAEIVSELEQDMDFVFVPCGTGTTAAGILSALDKTQLVGISALKGGGFLKEDVQSLLFAAGWLKEDIEEQMEQFHLESEYHFEGYAKYTDELLDFIRTFYQKHAIKLDQIYTGKMMFALYDKVKRGEFNSGSQILAIHTGGIQGTQTIPDLFV